MNQENNDKNLKRRNFLKVGLQAVGVLSIASVGGYFLTKKPDYKTSKSNPYDVGIDSIGTISPDKFIPVTKNKLPISLKDARALAIDSEDNIYISGDNKIVVLDKNGTEIRRFKTAVTATALAISSENLLFAAFENRISVYSLNGKIQSEWPVIEPKSYITSLAISDKSLFAADAEQEVVHEFSIDGKIIKKIGSSDKKDISNFVHPSYFFDVAVDPDGMLWAANTGKHKLIRFDSDGETLSAWGKTSAAVEGFCGCCNPSHFAIMPDGSFITTEKGIVRVKKYSPQGEFIGALAGPESFMQSSTGLEIAINSANEILVLEPAMQCIHVFGIK